MLWERVEPQVLEVWKLGDEIHHIALGTWRVYESQGSHLPRQVSEVLIEDGKERARVKVMKCEGGQLRECLKG